MFLTRYTKQLVATDTSHGLIGQTGSGTSQLEEHFWKPHLIQLKPSLQNNCPLLPEN